MSDIRSLVSNRLAQQRTTSEERRRYLQRLARLMCRENNPTVRFAKHDTAECRHNDGDLEIIIGNDLVAQTVTNLDERVWEVVGQEGLLVHEIGHVLYTDFEAWQDIEAQLGMHEASAFHKKVWNPAEDAAIEEQLRWKFNCARELDTYNANLFTKGKRSCGKLSTMDAVQVVILEKGCYETGILEEHLAGERELVPPRRREVFDNKVLPELNSMLADVMTEPDPQVRYDRMLEFWEFMKDLLQDETGEDAGSQYQDGPMGDAKPDDTQGMTPGQLADALEDMDGEQVEIEITQTGVPDDMMQEFADQQDRHEEGEEQDGDEQASAESGDSTEDGGEQDQGEDEQSPAQDGEGAESNGEDAESGATDEPEGEGEEDGEHDHDSDGGGGGGGGGMPGGEGSGFPGHEDHRIVIRD